MFRNTWESKQSTTETKGRAKVFRRLEDPRGHHRKTQLEMHTHKRPPQKQVSRENTSKTETTIATKQDNKASWDKTKREHTSQKT